MHFPAGATGGDGPVEKWQKRKSTLGAAVEEPGRVDPNTTVGETLGVAIHDPIALESEVTARMMRWIGNEHEMSQRVAFELEPGEVDVGPDVGVHHQERPGAEHRQRTEDAAAG